jgi:hypothetical protein
VHVNHGLCWSPVNYSREERASSPCPRATVQYELADLFQAPDDHLAPKPRAAAGTDAHKAVLVVDNCHPAFISTITYRQAPRHGPGAQGHDDESHAPEQATRGLCPALPCSALPCSALPCSVLCFSGPLPAGCRAGFGSRVTSVALLGLS